MVVWFYFTVGNSNCKQKNNTMGGTGNSIPLRLEGICGIMNPSNHPEGEKHIAMTIYLCLDDRNGMLFNKRRQSRDGAVLEDIRSGIPGELTITPFSEKLIGNAQIPYVLAPETLTELEENAHFFAEAPVAAELVERACGVVIYRWNRHYPADTHWEMDLAEYGFSLQQTSEFPGTSHEKITKEVYAK